MVANKTQCYLLGNWWGFADRIETGEFSDKYVNKINSFIFEGETGFIIPPHSVEKLSEIMENAILNKYDNEALTINCQTKAMLFDTKNIITSQFIEGLIKL